MMETIRSGNTEDDSPTTSNLTDRVQVIEVTKNASTVTDNGDGVIAVLRIL